MSWEVNEFSALPLSPPTWDFVLRCCPGRPVAAAATPASIHSPTAPLLGLLSLPCSQCAGDMVFLDDSRTLLFTTQTADTRRPDKVCPCHDKCPSAWVASRRLLLAPKSWAQVVLARSAARQPAAAAHLQGCACACMPRSSPSAPSALHKTRRMSRSGGSTLPPALQRRGPSGGC